VNILPNGHIAALISTANGTAGCTVNGTDCTAGSITMAIIEPDDLLPPARNKG
jgi:hypothetical protein